MIRFIVETVSSKRDVYGNCYHYAIVTSTKTNKCLIIKHCGGPDNARHYVHKVVEWSEMYSSETSLPIRQFDRLAKGIEKSPVAFFEHELTNEMLLALETETE